MPRPKKDWGVRYKNAADLYRLVQEHFPPEAYLPINRCMLAHDFTKTESDNLSLQQRVRRLASASSLKCPAATKESTATESGGFDMLLTAAAAFASLIQTKQLSAMAIPNSMQ